MKTLTNYHPAMDFIIKKGRIINYRVEILAFLQSIQWVLSMQKKV